MTAYPITDSRYRLRNTLENCLPQLSGLWAQLFATEYFYTDNPDGVSPGWHYKHPDALDISTEDRGKFAYSPDGVAHDDHTRRRKLALGRYLSRRHNVTITPEIERGIANVVTCLWFSDEDIDAEFEILRGEDVTDAYAASVGARSCMVGESNRHITEWFSLFPERIGLVVWRDTLGRALLWTSDCGAQLLDRIYSGMSDVAHERYGIWCAKNNVLAAYTHLPPAQFRDGTYKITLGEKAVDGRFVPYLDTFAYATRSGVFSNGSSGSVYECRYTDGSLDDNSYSCYDCEERLHPDDVITTYNDNHICQDCYESDYASCSSCGEIRRCCDMEFVDDDGAYCCGCFADRFASCDDCGETTRRDDLTFIPDVDLDVCEGCREGYEACEGCDRTFRAYDLSNVGDATLCCDCEDAREDETETETASA